MRPDCYFAQVRWLQQAAQGDFNTEDDDGMDEDKDFFNITDDGPPGKNLPDSAQIALKP